MKTRIAAFLLPTILFMACPFPCVAATDSNALGVALGAGQYEWTTSDDPWFVTTEVAFEGDSCVQSSGGGGGEVDTWMKTTVSGNAKWMSFLFQKSYYLSTFTVQIDGAPVFSDGSVAEPSEMRWLAVEIFIPAGTHELKFNYHHSGFGWKNELNGVRIDAVKMRDIPQDGLETNELGVAIEAAQYVWTTSEPPWFVSSEAAYKGASCVQSNGGDGEVADIWMKTTVFGNPKRMSFRFQKCYYLATFTVQVDGKPVFTDNSIAPPSEVEWLAAEVSIPGGKHEVKFNYHHPGYGWMSQMNGVRVDAVEMEDIVCPLVVTFK